MPRGMHQVEVHLPIENVWDFVKDMDNWAPLVPGYIGHQKFNERRSTWEFKSDIGIMKKKVSLLIDITKWNEPNLVTFNLKGLNEKFSGQGYFKAEEVGNNLTRMTGYLEIVAEGAMGSIVNNILKTSIPKTAEEMALAISGRLEELNRNLT